MTTATHHVPVEIRLAKVSRELHLTFEDDQTFTLSAEYLRVFSPSAEVRGHGPGQEVLQTHKEQVALINIEPVGHYAVKLIFDDGHDSGLYSWDYLYELGANHDTYWEGYLRALENAGVTRDGDKHE